MEQYRRDIGQFGSDKGHMQWRCRHDTPGERGYTRLQWGGGTLEMCKTRGETMEALEDAGEARSN